MTGFHHLPDEELDEIVRGFISDHGRTTGQGYVGGYIKALGLRIQRKRLRESMTRVDPQNTALRWGVVVSRRTYQVPWPNSLWHLDGHHALIPWKIVVHGCIDGFSRRIMFLRCNSNNRAETVLNLFLDATNRDGNLWPSRIRVDKGVENVLVCDAMVQARGREGGVNALKDCGEMFFDVYANFITIYSMLWSPLVSSTQIIKFICLLFTYSSFQESTKPLTSFVKPLITTRFVQKETGHHTKCGQMACSMLTIHYHMGY